MKVDEEQLEVWAKPGATKTAKVTADSVKSALTTYKWPEGVSFDTYLQGSYKNSTNIRGDNDVDVVCQLTSNFRSNTSEFSSEQLRIYNQMYPNATYNWSNFHNDVLLRLKDYYGDDKVNVGKKSIKILGGSSRLPADVVVAMSYRRFTRLVSSNDFKYIEGLTFYVPTENRWVVNFPKIHYDNGVTKNSESQTNGWFKPSVRIMKNIRSYLVDNNLLDKKNAPSYFIECLTYNIPNDSFGKSYLSTLIAILKYCVDEYNQNEMNDFVCQNEQLKLFGNSPEQWNTSDYFKYISKIVNILGD